MVTFTEWAMQTPLLDKYDVGSTSGSLGLALHSGNMSVHFSYGHEHVSMEYVVDGIANMPTTYEEFETKVNSLQKEIEKASGASSVVILRTGDESVSVWGLLDKYMVGKLDDDAHKAVAETVKEFKETMETGVVESTLSGSQTA